MTTLKLTSRFYASLLLRGVLLVRYWLVFTVLICGYANIALAEVKHYVVEGNFSSTNYETRLLTLILDASKAPDEVIELKRNDLYDQKIPRPRRVAAFAELDANAVMWSFTSEKMEDFLRPIRIPILKGIVGYRFLLIRKEDKAKFANIKSKKQLAQFVAGQGEQWEDTTVLRANGFPVITGSFKDQLYKMIAAKHFDYFPRGIGEIASEAKLIETYGLMVEPHLVLEYPNPCYFFVHKNNEELANRIKKGFDIIIKNGTFDTFFFNEHWVQVAIEKMNEQPRLIAHLKAPHLPKETPLNEPKYWLDASSFGASLPDDIAH